MCLSCLAYTTLPVSSELPEPANIPLGASLLSTHGQICVSLCTASTTHTLTPVAAAIMPCSLPCLVLAPDVQLASDDIDMFEAAAGTEDLMQALRHLTRLISLRLFCVELHAVDQQQVQQFSAITASSRLCSLKLSTERVQPLPKRAARHMFAAGRQLASLTQLHLNVWEGLDFEEDPLPGQHDPGRFWCLDTADIDRIAASCPALTVLQVQFAVRCSEAAMKSVVRLQQQLGLPELAIGGPNLRDDAGPILAQMTSLNVLRICHSPGFTHEGLRHLTALQQLTSLGFNICDCCGEAGPRWTESPKWFGAGASDQVCVCVAVRVGTCGI